MRFTGPVDLWVETIIRVCVVAVSPDVDGALKLVVSGA